jgi:hypothetical protein
MIRILIRLLVLAAVIAQIAGCHEQVPATAQEIAVTVKSHSEWIADAQRCPADFMGHEDVSPLPESRFCNSSDLTECLERCVAGQGPSCYWLGQDLQAAKADNAAVDVLYHRSCKLGVASGCTNYAAGLVVNKKGNPEKQSCALKTFEHACALDDPWGCTMFAFELTQGSDTEQSRTRALAALEKSCRYGTKDPACDNGKHLQEQLMYRDRK